LKAPVPNVPAPKPIRGTTVSGPTFIWYAASVAEPPLPESEALAAIDAVKVYVFAVGTDTIWCSAFSIAAVITPPKEAALLKVTKSPITAP